MLAELAAANAAFAVIKAALANGKELSDIGSKALEYFDYKSKLQESANQKAGGRPIEGRSDLEEFMALEKLRQQEEHLKAQMVYAGRPGMWDDWMKFQAMAARKRREAKEAEVRRIALKKEKFEQMVEYVVVAIASVILAGFIIYGIVLYMKHLR
jgi:hypothetical protein